MTQVLTVLADGSIATEYVNGKVEYSEEIFSHYESGGHVKGVAQQQKKGGHVCTFLRNTCSDRLSVRAFRLTCMGKMLYSLAHSNGRVGFFH